MECEKFQFLRTAANGFPIGESRSKRLGMTNEDQHYNSDLCALTIHPVDVEVISSDQRRPEASAGSGLPSSSVLGLFRESWRCVSKCR